MPELPEVETVRRTLKNFIIGKKITKINVIYPKIIENDQNDFIDLITGKTILDIDRFGKYLIFCFEDIAFLSHLRMEGKYQIVEYDVPLSKHDHVVFYLDDGRQLRYNDTRKFGRMKLVDRYHYRDELPLSKLGPEPFEANVDDIYQKLKKKKLPIKHVLLDQSIMSGIGNIYANEICFAMKINPQAKCCYLTKKRVKELIDISCEILNRAIAQGGTTIHSFSANGIDGLFQVQLQVHGQKECQLCHEPIQKIFIQGRGTYYCPHCQKVRR